MLRDDEKYAIHHGDCIPHLAEMPPESVDFCLFSPPFPSLFSYTSLPSDIGNSENLATDAKIHFNFLMRQLRKVMKPGRIMVIHVMQIPGLARNGELGTFDFRGLIIRMAQKAGFIYQYDWLVPKNPQAQAIRTHSHKLLFVSLERDRAISCGAFGDYLIKFITPGENKVPIDSAEITRNEWIKWAEAAWYGIRETYTLNTKEAKSPDDVRHICPLQLDVIERLVKLYSNPGELLFSAFAGIGSELYVALKLGRRAYGCELKDEYHKTAIKNCERALQERFDDTPVLFDACDEEEAVTA